MRKHLNLRTSEQDEKNILFLASRWQLDRSEATRKAISLAASWVREEPICSKKELLEHSEFIGSEGASNFSSTNYKKALKQSLKNRHAQ